MNARAAGYIEDFSKTLTEISVDQARFRVTSNPVSRTACILWYWDGRIPDGFRALGQFSSFEKRKIIQFVAKYTTSALLRDEIERRRFQRRVDALDPTFFRDLQRLSPWEKEAAYRNLFNLDILVEPGELDRRRRMMAKRFHPDAGGDHRCMTAINEAYDYLKTRMYS